MSTVLVTGSTDGLGRAVATELAARGDEVIVHGRSFELAERRPDLQVNALHPATLMGTREARAHPQAYDRAARERLWEISEELTGLA